MKQENEKMTLIREYITGWLLGPERSGGPPPSELALTMRSVARRIAGEMAAEIFDLLATSDEVTGG